MSEGKDGFSSGDYHSRFSKFTENRFWRKYLDHSYGRGLQLVREAGWDNPVTADDANVLLCGTGTPETSSTFVRFVKDQNPQARIHILDKERSPLERSRERLWQELGEASRNIDIRQEDALHTSFPDSSFTGIETDLFLEFFPQKAKQELLQEWFRILRPGGIITTRDFVQTTGGSVERNLASLQRKAVTKAVHAPTYGTTRDELSGLFKGAGFEIKITPARLPIVGLRVPLANHIIARRPKSEPVAS